MSFVFKINFATLFNFAFSHCRLVFLFALGVLTFSIIDCAAIITRSKL